MNRGSLLRGRGRSINIIANSECQHSQNNTAGLYVSLSLQSHQSPDVSICLYLRAVHRYVKKLILNFKVASLLP